MYDAPLISRAATSASCASSCAWLTPSWKDALRASKSDSAGALVAPPSAEVPLFKLVCRFDWAQSDIRTCRSCSTRAAQFVLVFRHRLVQRLFHTRTFQICMRE
eukprot:COSAG03_NODE_298_length_9236_cov_126.932253_5_plen_104_part_00